MKRLISVLVMLSIILSMAYISPIYADSSDSDIQAKIDELWNMLGNSYFTVDRSTGCGKKSSGHSCTNCYTPNIVNTTWFKNMFGNISAYQFPYTYYNNGEQHGRPGWSCFGFASFAEWYIFKSFNSDTVNTYHAGTYNFNYSNVSNYAKKGDLIRLHNGGDGGHSVIFMGATSTGIQVIHSNWTGDYNCFVRQDTIKYSSNSYSYSKFTISRANNRTVSTQPPSNPGNLRSDKTTYSTSESINLYWDAANGATHYWVYMWKDGVELYATNMGNTTAFTSAPTSSGNYTFIVRAANSYGYSSGVSYSFTVSDDIPGPVTNIWSDKAIYMTNDNITFYWDKANNAEQYWVYLWKDGSQLGLDCAGSNTYYTTKLGDEGKYTLVIRPCNSNGFNEGSTSFSVFVHSQPPISLGDVFYGKILNKGHWKPIVTSNGDIKLTKEKGYSNELWKFSRCADGSYEILSCLNGQNLMTYSGGVCTGTTLNTLAKKWYIYNCGNGIILKNQDSQKVLELDGNCADEGTNILLKSFSGDSSQIFNIYSGSDVQLTSPTLSITSVKHDKVTIKWSAVSCPSNYKITVYDENDLSNPVYTDDTSWDTTTYTLKLPTGRYVASVKAYNYFGGMNSNNVNFSLVTPISTSVSKNNNTLNFTSTLNVDNASGSSVLLAVFDESGKMIGLRSCEYKSTVSFSMPYNDTMEYAKVLVFNKISGLKPLCENEYVPVNDF